MSQEHEFDVALSFAGEDRGYVEQVARHLKDSDVKVFYDRYEEASLWGRDLYAHLDEVYRTKARFCVMFISEHYGKKLWPNHERASAQARAFEENTEYILPARFDDTEIPGVLPTTSYIDLSSRTPAQFAALIVQKLAEDRPQRAVSTTRSFRKPKLRGNAVNPYDAAMRFITDLKSGLTERCQALVSQGVSLSVFDRGEHACLRFVHDGTTKYSLDVWLGGIAGDDSVSFYGVRGAPIPSSGSSNAWAHILADSDSRELHVDLHDLSLLSHLGRDHTYTFPGFIDALWNEICDALED